MENKDRIVIQHLSSTPEEAATFYLSKCGICGAAVLDKEQHDNFHKQLQHQTIFGGIG